MKSTIYAMIALGLVCGFVTFGHADTAQEGEIRLDSATFLEYLDELKDKVTAGDPRRFRPREMRRFNEIHRRFNRLLAGVDSIDQLGFEHRVEVFNLQEELKSLLIGENEDRVVCRRRQRVGTHFRQTECWTVGEIRDQQKRGRELSERLVNYPMPTRGEGP